MSCCRSRKHPQPAARTTGICVNCGTSMREQIKEAISSNSKQAMRPGTYRLTTTIVCGCGWNNKFPLTFTKR